MLLNTIPISIYYIYDTHKGNDYTNQSINQMYNTVDKVLY